MMCTIVLPFFTNHCLHLLMRCKNWLLLLPLLVGFLISTFLVLDPRTCVLFCFLFLWQHPKPMASHGPRVLCCVVPGFLLGDLLGECFFFLIAHLASFLVVMADSGHFQMWPRGEKYSKDHPLESPEEEPLEGSWV